MVPWFDSVLKVQQCSICSTHNTAIKFRSGTLGAFALVGTTHDPLSAPLATAIAAPPSMVKADTIWLNLS